MISTTLTDILREKRDIPGIGITFIESGHVEEFFSYGELYAAALKALYFLQQRGLQPGNELVFQVADNKTFIILFWACQLGGILPVPLSVGQHEEHRLKPFAVWKVLNNPFLVIAGNDFMRLGSLAMQKGLQDIYEQMDQNRLDGSDALAAKKDGQPVLRNENDIAFLQFSSGSTGHPKGVTLTHKNLLTNMRAIAGAADYTPADAMLSWMPLTHDMGLIGFHLNPLLIGMQQYLMPVNLFIRRPSLWLQKASEHRISILSSPNFGYKYLLRNLGAGVSDGWDLSGVRIIYNGAEPISEKTAREFLEQLSTTGLPASSICPVYGLAEATLAVSMSDWKAHMKHVEVDRNYLRTGDRIVLCAGGEDAVSFVNVGKAVDNCRIMITDPEQNELAEGIIGHVFIQGNAVTGGYYNNTISTRAAASRHGWWDTGDIGFIKEGSLFITGRHKDIIYIAGQNYYPHDLERVVEEAGLAELNKFVTGGYFNAATQKEEIIGFVFYRDSLEKFVPLALAIKALVADKTGAELQVLVPVKDIPRTTSGKLQRFKLLEQFRAGQFNEPLLVLQRLNEEREKENNSTGIPSNDKERTLLEIARSVLRHNNLGIQDDFFAAGANSLKAAAFAMAVWKEFQVELSLEMLYAHPSVAQLATLISQLPGQAYHALGNSSEAPLLNDLQLPLSSAQTRLYYQWQMDKSNIAYNMPLAFAVTGNMNASKLESAIRVLIQRHEILRTSFSMEAAPMAILHQRVPFLLQQVHCVAANLQSVLSHFVQPFDLAVAPLFRVGIVQVENGQQLLVADFHHIMADGASVAVFIEELLQVYDGKVLPPLSAQYKDYVSWEAGNLVSARTAAQEKYWQSQLLGKLPVLQMPADRSRPVLFNTAGARVEHLFPADTVNSLRQLATANRCTVHTLLLTIYKIALSKYTGQEDLVIGIPVAGRRHPDLQGTLGMFVNNLASRTRIIGTEPFTSLLEREHNNLNLTLYNQDYPFASVLGWADTEKDSSRNRVFDTMFIYQDALAVNRAGETCRLTRHFFDAGFSKYDISMEIMEEGHSMKYAIEYASSLFEPGTIGRFITHFGQLVQSVIDNPDCTVAELALLTTAEHQEYTCGFNSTDIAYPAAHSVHQLFAEQAARCPNDTAVEWAEGRMSYGTLNEKTDQLAASLQARGIGAGSIVGMLLPRSPEMVVAIMGILKAGACYLPIDISLPEERIKYILRDSRCITVMATADLVQLVANLHYEDGDPAIVVLDANGLAIGYERRSQVTVAAYDADSRLAYIIYTSGTTGQPKGVMVGHKSLLNYISWAAAQYSRQEKLSYALYTSISFDLTVTSIFTPLVTGGRIVVYEGEGDGSLIEKVIEDNKSDIIKATPSHLKLVLSAVSPDTMRRSRIRKFIIGGEDLETRVAEAICRQFGAGVEMFNEYGPTEATVGCMIHAYNPAEQHLSVPIGIPAANTQIYLLNKYLQPVPTGVPGEIYIAGDGLALGYAGNAALTAAKFVPHPFVAGKRMYKTGDLARRLPNGTILYGGRTDRQVKLNGHRIELAEIENQLLSHEGMHEALLLVKTDSQQNKNLYAYYTCTDGHTTIAEAYLKNYLSARLPYYMIPVRFTCLSTIPLTGNGKVDYNALPDPATEKEQPGIKMPGNALEDRMLQVWKHVLGQDDLSVTDNFFELGGDSIKAVQIVSALGALGVSVAVKDILVFHTVEQVCLKAIVKEKLGMHEQGFVQGERALLPIEAWFFGRQFAHPGNYSQSVLLQMHNNPHPVFLATVFEKLIGQHDGLRINYNAVNNTLFYNDAHINQPFVLEETGADAALPVTNPFFVAGKYEFDISNDLLVKAALYKENGSDYLLITAHHLVMDGLSWRILLEDLYLLCAAQGNAARLPRKTAGAPAFLAALSAMAPSVQQQEAYWRTMDQAAGSLPLDWNTTEWNAGQQRKMTTKLHPALTAALLVQSPQRYETEVPVLLNTALLLALQEWTGQSCFTIEQENFGRQALPLDTARTVGWFTTLYPLKLTLTEGPLQQQVTSIKDQFAQVADYGIGYGILKYINRPVSETAEPPASIRFNYLGQFGREFNNDLFSFDERFTGLFTHPDNAVTALLDCNAMVMNGELLVEFNYHSKAHKASTIHRLQASFINHIERMLQYHNGEEGFLFATPGFNTAGLNETELDTIFE